MTRLHSRRSLTLTFVGTFMAEKPRRCRQMVAALRPLVVKRLLMGTLTFALGASPLLAQSVERTPGPTRPLTLADALRIAREQNPDHQRALNTVGPAAANVRRSMGALLPKVSAAVSYNGNSSQTVTSTDNFGRPIRLPDPTSYSGSGTSQSLSLSVPIFDAGRGIQALRAARADARATDARLHEAEANLAADVARSYYAALRTRRLIALQERVLAAARGQLDVSQRLFRVAAQSRVDVLGAEEVVATEEGTLAAARADDEKAILALGFVMGVESAGSFTLAESFPAPFDPSALTSDSLVALAARQSPRLAALDATAFSTARQRTSAHASRWPTVSGNAGVSRSLSAGGYRAFGEVNPLNRSVSFGFNVSLPVFDGFATGASIAQADAAAASAEQNVRGGRLAVTREVRGALIDLANAFRGIRFAERSVALSRERVELAREQYRVGAIRYEALQTIIDRTTSAERAEIEARLVFANALVALETSVGAAVRP